MRKYWILFLVFILVVVVHFIVQFFAWSFAPGNTAFKQTGLTLTKVFWAVLSFPLVWIVPRGIGDSLGWIILWSNSIIWGAGLTFLISLLFKNK